MPRFARQASDRRLISLMVGLSVGKATSLRSNKVASIAIINMLLTSEFRLAGIFGPEDVFDSEIQIAHWYSSLANLSRIRLR
jgi:hypothetical protein